MMATVRRKRLELDMPESGVLRGSLDAFRMMGVEFTRQNTGGGINPRGDYVAFGEPGDSDIRGQIPAHWPGAGKLILCECKRESFDPRKLKSGSKARADFDRQLHRLKGTYARGGYGFWVTDPAQTLHVLRCIREGWRVTWEGDWPYLTDEEA